MSNGECPFISCIYLAAATRHWLEFQILCNREMLLSESYLAQPVGEFPRNEYNLPIQTECNHPNLNRPGPGRPRQIDYVLLARDKQRITTAIEAKWISEQAAVLNRFVDDVFRLECLRNIGKTGNIDRYFLVAGRNKSIRANLFNRKKSKEAKSSIKAILPVNKADTIRVKVKDCETSQRKLYKQFSDSYKAGL